METSNGWYQKASLLHEENQRLQKRNEHLCNVLREIFELSTEETIVWLADEALKEATTND